MRPAMNQEPPRRPGYQALSMPILAFGDLWVSALESTVVLRVDIPD